MLFRWPIHCQLLWRQSEWSRIMHAMDIVIQNKSMTLVPYVQIAQLTLCRNRFQLSIRVNSWKRSTGSFKDFSKYFSTKIIKPNSFRFSKQSKQLADEQIVSLIDFVSTVLKISKSCVYSMNCVCSWDVIFLQISCGNKHKNRQSK